MARGRKPSPLMGAAQAMLDGVSDSIVREGSRFSHSMEVAIDRVRPDPEQPRKVFDDGEIAKLARTMADQGQLQPVLVRRDADARGHWILVAGERRWRAAAANGWGTILAIEHTGDAEVATLIENLQRVDLAAVEEARGLHRLLQTKGWSQARAAQALGKTAAEVSSVLRILTLPPELLDGLLATKDFEPSRYVLAELARVGEGPQRDRLIRAALNGTLTQRMVRAAREPQGTDGGEPDLALDNLGPPRLSTKSVKTLRSRLREMREQAAIIGRADLALLEDLRAEIDELLAAHESNRH